MLTRLIYRIKPISLFKRYLNTMDSANANQEVTSKQQSSDFFSVKKRSKKKWTEEEKAEKKRQLKLRREENKSNKNTSFTGDCIDHTEYYFENGLRKVKVCLRPDYTWYNIIALSSLAIHV